MGGKSIRMEGLKWLPSGRLCSNRPLNRPLLKTIMGRVWGVSDREWGVEIKLSTKESSFLIRWNSTRLEQGSQSLSHKWAYSIAANSIDHTSQYGAPGQFCGGHNGPPNLSSLGQIQSRNTDPFSPSSSSNLGIKNKGKEVFLGDSFDLNASDHVLSKSILNSGEGSMKKVIGEGFNKAKRSGSWRDEGVIYSGDGTNSLDNVPDLTEKVNLINNMVIDPNTLMDVPIIYDTRCDSLKKNEGPSKRRKVIPKRSIKPHLNNPDWITWHPTPNGTYSVASGYKLRFINPATAECSNLSSIKAWWKFVWGSILTPKMKNFLWRLFHHWLPTKIELTRRGMALDTRCDLCNQQEEDICHALWIFPSRITNAADFIWWLKDHIPKDDFIRFIGFSWLVWQRRNKFIFQHKGLKDQMWIRWAADLLELQLGSHQNSPPKISPKQVMKWLPPPLDFCNINTDASLVVGQSGFSLSAVIRDSKGSLVVAEAEFTPGCTTVLQAEAAAILLGLKLAVRWAIFKAQICSDSHTIIQAIHHNSTNYSDWDFASTMF
ncbi:hypothetical protein F8388_017090 [Cannabis sativa]|uniref:RNase H type-1 domain-containing protein n=1 Tax=Cannabis sativa TaxID=3483 RepID=A0A7J6HE66_CANSA|nr:hypothetical protein F8388_017090 [Cannabis sativa]KAF4393151.1 hypothetical protein G4B88_001885 [Cannabis sativa]